jgi:hypothetical protein
MGSSIPGRLNIPSILLPAVICMILIVSSGCMSMTDNGNKTAADETHPANENETIPTVEINETSTPATFLPEITPAEVTGDLYEDRTFNTYFEKSQYELTLPVNLSVYYGAKNADKSITPGTMWNETEKVSEYYRSFFEGEAIEGFYTDILKKIRHIKTAEGFSDEEYLEFMITFVQQIPYDSEAYEPRFPVEVIYDMKGDCDEKSMLLIGMLSREGYDTALIIFPEYRHATAGIRIIISGDTSFRQFKSEDLRKYVFIESTGLSYIGQYPEYYEDAYAVVIPIGDGNKTFEKYNYVSYITESLTKITNRILFFQSELNMMYDEIKGLESDLTGGKIYDSDLDWHNDYTKYINLVNKYYEYEDLLNRNVEVYNYIIEHPYDVDGVRRYIYNSKVNEIEY